MALDSNMTFKSGKQLGHEGKKEESNFYVSKKGEGDTHEFPRTMTFSSPHVAQQPAADKKND